MAGRAGGRAPATVRIRVARQSLWRTGGAVSRLTEAQAALEAVSETIDQEFWPDYQLEERDQLRAALARMAQLEKVAELARTSVRGPDSQDAEHTTLLLDLAITELDN